MYIQILLLKFMMCLITNSIISVLVLTSCFSRFVIQICLATCTPRISILVLTSHINVSTLLACAHFTAPSCSCLACQIFFTRIVRNCYMWYMEGITVMIVSGIGSPQYKVVPPIKPYAVFKISTVINVGST